MGSCFIVQGAQLSALLEPWGLGWVRGVWEGVDICMPRAHSYSCTRETNTVLQRNYIPIKKGNETVILYHSVQFSSLTQFCLILCDPKDCSMLGFPVDHQFSEFTQNHVHRPGDAIQPSHPLFSPSPPAFSLSQHEGLSQWVSSSHHVAKVLEFQLQR